MGRVGALCLFLPALAALGGCGGHYILTVPDQVASAGGETAAVVRLQRNDFFVLSNPITEAAMRFRVGDGPLRGAYTDKLGYAGASVSVPAEPGLYRLSVAHLDLYGDEVVQEAPAYVWASEKAVVAVDLDALPGLWLGSGADAARAIGLLAKGANIVYLTRRSTRRHGAAHRELARAGYPDGPILLWRRQRWHIVRDGWANMPRLAVESRLVSQLAELRKLLPNLTTGVCRSQLAAKAVAEAGLKCVAVNSAHVRAATGTVHRSSWADLADKGL
jgi:hypothetical protein